MRRLRHLLVFLVPLVFGTAGSAAGVDRLILGKSLDVRNQSGLESQRRISGTGKEKTTDVPSLSNPTSSGATLTVIANGGTDSNQTYVLDASGWKATVTGYTYRGPTAGDGDPVRMVILRRSASGIAQLKVSIAGSVGTQSVDVVPPDPGDDGGYILAVTGGDRYCVAFGAGAGGSEVSDTPLRWRLKDAQAQPGCPTGGGPSTTTTTTLPAPSACPGDPSRTIYAGGPNTSACHQFDNDQPNCEKAFHTSQDCGPASCWFDFQSGDCNGCGPDNRQNGQCVNTCVEGPASCPGDPSRTIFAGFSNSSACHNLDFSQTLCEKAFHMTQEGYTASCYWDVAYEECNGCGPNHFNNGDCQNTCPACEGDPSHNVFAGGPNSSGCHKFDASPDSCAGAFLIGDNGIADPCYYDDDNTVCNGCGPNNQSNAACLNSCAVCQNDAARQIYLGGPNTGPCHFFDNSPVLCEQAFHLSGMCGVLSSCYYDYDYGSCNGCGPNNMIDGACDNTCQVPLCGDGGVNQPNEQCDGDNLGSCSTSCTFDCQCTASPSGAFLDDTIE